MPIHLNWLFTPGERQEAELVEPFSFTKGCNVLKVRFAGRSPDKAVPQTEQLETMLFNLKEDPSQQNLIQDQRVEARLIEVLVE